MPRRGRSWAARTGWIGVLLALGLLASSAPVRGATYPHLSDPGRDFLSNLTLPAVDPGGSATLSFTVGDPANFTALSAVVATFGVYAFNGFPGNAPSFVPVAHAPVLDNGSASGPEVNVSVGALAPGTTYSGSLRVVTSPATPQGTFAIRTALSFSSVGKDYRLESRGWFSAGLWANATAGPNGSATVNLSKLNVSAVVPETALLVNVSDWPWVLGGLLGAGLVLVGAGAWVYFRKTAASRSGAG